MESDAAPVWNEVRVGDCCVRYLTAGVGEPVILLHGLSGSVAWWKHNFGPLSDRFRVYAVEFVLLADRWKPVFDLAQAADRLAEWMTAVHIPRASVVGHSMGGHIAARLAAEIPERVHKLILVNAATFVPFSLERQNLVRLLRWLPTFPLTLMPVLTRDALRAGPFSLWKTSRELLATDLRKTVSEIACPTMIVWGGRDGLLPVELAHELHTIVPNSVLHVMPEAGHNPMWEKPAAFNDLASSFLKSSPGRASGDPLRAEHVLVADPEDKIHVLPIAPNDWEVEVQSGDAVAHEPDKETAVAVALDVARKHGIETVIVHDGDGVTEELHSAYRHEEIPALDLEISKKPGKKTDSQPPQG